MSGLHPLECQSGVPDEAGARINQAGVDLHGIGTRPDFADGIVWGQDAANPDDREVAAQGSA